MPRPPQVASSVIEFPGKPLPPPPELTAEQQAIWHEIVDPFPAERFDAGSVPVLIGLVCHMVLARQLNEQLEALRKRTLITSAAKGQRQIFLELAKMAQAESHLIAMLSVKLRLTDQSKTRKLVAERARESMPIGPRPWD
jgi:hypothetical protein